MRQSKGYGRGYARERWSSNTRIAVPPFFPAPDHAGEEQNPQRLMVWLWLSEAGGGQLSGNSDVGSRFQHKRGQHFIAGLGDLVCMYFGTTIFLFIVLALSVLGVYLFFEGSLFVYFRHCAFNDARLFDQAHVFISNSVHPTASVSSIRSLGAFSVCLPSINPSRTRHGRTMNGARHSVLYLCTYVDTYVHTSIPGRY